MSEIALGIWRNAPVWVWPLFFILVFLGLKVMRTRNSSIIPYFFFPFLGLTAANAVSGLVHVPTNWVVFAGSYLVGVALAFQWQDSLILQKNGWTMRLKGERVTILILMVIFFSNFVNGVMEAVSPQLREATLFTVIFASVLGGCSGSFTGRALRIVTLRNRALSTQ